MVPYTENQRVRIVNNIVKAATEDINKLSNQAYKFLYLASGFIAHYNYYGFMAYYNEPGKLKKDLLANRHYNQWLNFRPGERDYDYYMSKADIYNRVCNRLI